MDAHSGRSPMLSASTPQALATDWQNLRHFVPPSGENKLAELRVDDGPAIDVPQMLSRLCARMQVGADYPWPGTDPKADITDENAAIPSGYTYLAQLAAHDLVEHTVQLPLIGAFPGELQRDYRVQQLTLDTIYGGGPATNPLPYGVGSGSTPERCLFRLGHVRAREPQPFEKNPAPPLVDQPARDIPRGRCPFLSDQPALKATPDALIGDTRNDQHVIIAQLAAFFHQFHNILFNKVRALQEAPTPEQIKQLNLPQSASYSTDESFRQAQNDMAFLQTRKLLAFVWRKIVVQDLLKKLLEPGVYSYYIDPSRAFPLDFLDPVRDFRVPAEFSHAVYRFGHVMARFSYKLNDVLSPDPSIKALLDRSSAVRPDLLPLASNWLVDWSLFFDLSDGKSQNLSRPITPYIAFGPLAFEAAVPEEKGRTGGLFFRDFLRGYQADLASVSDVIEALVRKRPSEINRSDLLKDANLREHDVGTWLRFVPNSGFTPDEMTALSKDPPLLFFVLFEAAHTQAGQRLGILGSTLVAEVFFSALEINKKAIEDDPALQVLTQLIFGGSVPVSVPAAIKYVKSEGGLKEVDSAGV